MKLTRLLAPGVLLAAVAAGAASSAAAATAPASAGGAVKPAGTVTAWQPPVAENALGAALDLDQSDPGDAVSCVGTSYCAMVGTLTAGSVTTGWVWDRTDGTWDSPRQIPGLAALNQGGWAEAVTVACASPGNCAAGGSDGDTEPFVVSESHGVWGKAQAVSHAPWPNDNDEASIDAISCGAPGDCVAVGTDFTDGPVPPASFLVEERGGTWGPARNLPVGQDGVSAPSCPSAGNCTIVAGALVMTESGFRWTDTKPVLGTAAEQVELGAVSCWSAGNCVALGGYRPPADPSEPVAVRVTETSGHWGSAHPLGVGPEDDYDAPSCVTGGYCVVATTSHLITETDGRWGKPVPVPAEYDPELVSCSAPGYCSVGGEYNPGNEAFDGGAVIDEVDGKWQQWNVLPGTTVSDPNAFGSSLDALSCGAPDNCALYGDVSGPDQGDGLWVAVKRVVPVTATTFTLSAGRLVYGREQAGRASVSVTASSGTPSGTVTVTAGGTIACVVTVRAGHGSCALSATGLAAGTHEVTADYGINAGFGYSHSAPVRLVVGQASTVTRLALAHGSVRYGDEDADRISVSVAPRYAGTPTGLVLVKMGQTTLCVVKLRDRKGSCALSAQQLKPGRYRLTARYAGSGSFLRSASAAAGLIVTGDES